MKNTSLEWTFPMWVKGSDSRILITLGCKRQHDCVPAASILGGRRQEDSSEQRHHEIHRSQAQAVWVSTSLMLFPSFSCDWVFLWILSAHRWRDGGWAGPCGRDGEPVHGFQKRLREAVLQSGICMCDILEWPSRALAWKWKIACVSSGQDESRVPQDAARGAEAVLSFLGRQ